MVLLYLLTFCVTGDRQLSCMFAHTSKYLPYLRLEYISTHSITTIMHNLLQTQSWAKMPDQIFAIFLSDLIAIIYYID